jgi:hypothetical protein
MKPAEELPKEFAGRRVSSKLLKKSVVYSFCPEGMKSLFAPLETEPAFAEVTIFQTNQDTYHVHTFLK